MKRVTKCGWRHAPEVRGRFWVFRRKLRELNLDAERGGGVRLLGLAEARRICTPWVPHEIRARWRSQHKKIVSLSFNSKVIKRFRTWTKKSLRVFEFLDSCVLHYVYMLPTFNIRFAHGHIHVYGYVTIWLNSMSASWSANELFSWPSCSLS